MSMDRDYTINATGGFNSTVECWGCTNYPRYYAERFHTYINCPNKRDPDVAEQANQSTQEYAQNTSTKGGSRIDQGSQEKPGQKSSM